jgi:crotonobetainyl-CoA:carnitine CoA-transferase CaiB-like acyl-CoA transferase
MSLMERPFTGLTVLDFTQFIAGPVATRIMAELGAEVIKIELAPGGDLARVLPTIKEGRSAYYVQHNVGKKSLCLDVRRQEAIGLIKKLVARADVLVENFSPGAIARIGLGWDVARDINPRLLMCSISAFGQTGPLSHLKGFDHIAQSYSGVTSMIGEPDAAPALPGVAIGDVGTGITALAAINAALYRLARHGGKGQWLDIALIAQSGGLAAGRVQGQAKLHHGGGDRRAIRPRCPGLGNAGTPARFTLYR